jgi:hypothetical protein
MTTYLSSVGAQLARRDFFHAPGKRKLHDNEVVKGVPDAISPGFPANFTKSKCGH